MNDPSVVRQVMELQDMPFSELKEKYRELFGKEPPAANRKQVIARLAYRIQEIAYGGLSEQTKAKLEWIYEKHGDPRKGKRERRRREKQGIPVPGTRLIRDWQGGRYEVTVLHEGFEYEGKVYRSLSAVTKAITGAHWSGPNFFGLRRAAPERPSPSAGNEGRAG
jgi:hypothetical protein